MQHCLLVVLLLFTENHTTYCAFGSTTRHSPHSLSSLQASLHSTPPAPAHNPCGSARIPVGRAGLLAGLA